MSKNLGARIRNHFERKLSWWLNSTWALLFVIFTTVVVIYPLEDKCGPLTLGELRVYSQNRDRVALWDRQKAIQFGLTQTTTIINYVFVAAAALLGLIGKLLLDPLVSADKAPIAMQKPESTLLKHAAIGCFFSMYYGYFGYNYIAKIPTAQDFNPFEELALGASFQQISFLIAVGLLVLAASVILKKANTIKEGAQ